MEQKHALGRRKSAVARVYVVAGTGNIVINGRELNEYFKEETLQYIVNQPFEVTGTTGQFDVKVTLVGGGTKGQAEAVRLGISRALCEVDKEAYRSAWRTPSLPVQQALIAPTGLHFAQSGRPNPATPVRMRIFPSYNKDCRDCGKIAETVPRGNATPD